MSKIKFLVILFFASFLIVFLNSKREIKASEGTIELRSTTEQDYRCFAASLRMQDLEFRIPYSCRNLIYPIDDSIFNYVVWAQPLEGGTGPVRLGTLGLGKGEFKTKTAFSGLFVTVEASANPRTPSGKIVMRGSVTPIKFLEEEKLSPSPTQPQEIEEKPTATIQPLSTREKFITAVRRAGLAAILALAGLIGLIFVITRS